MKEKLTESDWKKKLSPEKYQVLREKATEKPFSGDLLKNKESGDYLCGACGVLLFKSDTKFDSGTGWPSFYDGNMDNILLKEDNSLGMKRVEVLCKNCGSHLGHLFNDALGTPTGNRFCINSCALKFKKK